MDGSTETEKKELSTEEQLASLSGPYELTNGQLQWLMEKMSSDDQQSVKNQMKSCARETFLTRGLPISAAITASVYFARKKLPDNLHFGPKNPWIFTGVIGVASLLVSQLLNFGTCLDRTRPLLLDLYKKYDQIVPKSSYDKMRTANRQGLYHAFENMHKAAYPEDFK